MQLISILLIQLSLMFVGALIAISLGVKKRIEIVGLSYLLGSGIVAILFLIFHWLLNLKLDQVNFLLSLGTSVLFPFFIILVSKKNKILKNFFKFKLKNKLKTLSKIEKSILTIIVLLVSYSIFENYFWPIIDWDALAFYDFRAKVMAMTGNMLEGAELKYFFQYPPYTSFLHVFGYIFGAERIKIAYSFIYASLILTFFNLLRRKQSRLISLIFTLLLASTPMIFEHSIIAYSNLPYTTFFSLGLIYLWTYFGKGATKDLFIGGTLVGLSTWVRSTEPFWMVGAILIILGGIKHRSHLGISITLLFLLNLPSTMWRKFLIQLDSVTLIKIIDVESHTTGAIKDFLTQGQSFLQVLIRLWEVFKYLFITLFPEFILITFLLTLVAFKNLKSRKIEILSLLIILSIIFGGTLIFSFTFETWDLIGGSIVRMAMVFIPLVLYVVAKDFKNEKQN